MGFLSCCCECFTDGHIDRATFKRATKRSCTDVLFLILLVLFMAGTVVIGLISHKQGDWRRLVYGFDDYGNICGVENEKIAGAPLSGQDMTKRPSVFFMLFKNEFTGYDLGYTARCVEECPDEDLTVVDNIDEMVEKSDLYCQYNLTVDDDAEYMKQMDLHRCPGLIYKSHTILRRCIPDVKDALSVVVTHFEKMTWLEYAFADVVNSWKQITGMCLLSIVIAALMTLFVRFLARFLIYVSTVLFIVGAILSIAAVWYVFVMEYKKLQAIPEDDRLSSMENQVDYFLYLAIAVSIVMAIVLLILVVMFPRMKVVVKLFEEASRVVQAIPFILFTPVLTFIVLSLFFAYWLFVTVFVATAEKTTIEAHLFVRYEPAEAYVRYFWWYMLVALIWGMEFILAAHQFVIAFATAKWYNFEDKSNLSCPIIKGIVCLMKNHMGSIALGSFIITLVKIPRMILMYIDKKLKGTENAAAKAVLKCMQCFLWCLEKVLKFLNKNAYIVIALTGKSFCPSAQQAMVILVSNALRVAALNTIGTFVIFLCKAGVSAIVAAIGLIWFKEDEELNYYFVPAVCAAIFAYFAASCFFGVFDLVLDTLLVCVSEDSHENDAVDAPHECKTLKAKPEFMRDLKDAGDQYDTVKSRKKKEPKSYNVELQGEGEKQGGGGGGAENADENV
ncbi:choline transporter-like protein 1 isoform X2 [Symsagittifera roscoffensis]|uniref:choline transporter-like protein 1 isoform X2 n=1 Tax=Symsagittifera roscoffensis TaxID=84072 RepID=UPI00307BF4CE